MNNFLNKLVSAFGVGGKEEAVKELIKTQLKDIKCEIKEDKLGNLIVKMGQGKEKVMVCTHMDVAGFMTTFVEDNGFIRVGSVGSVDYKNSLGRMVTFQNGAKGRLCAAKENPEERDLYIDILSNTREEALKEVKEGDVASFLGHLFEKNGKIMGSNLHRIGCYVLLEAIKNAKNLSKEYYFVFSTQKELGGRGARAAAYTIEPDYCVVIDSIKADDVVGEDGRVKLSSGPVLSIMDGSLIIDEEVRIRVEEAAIKGKIKLQYGVSRENTDGGRIHKEVGGIRTGVVSIPCRYKYSSNEVMDVKDIEETIKLFNGLL
ncbi:M42 family metallopeptidase [Haloimpatiens sp. FM7315]|uniref:M42 family metallopeptidase n=1 Tax=Haloimpatiens sp. FM7315 TaxID=3298609 RepID=UPI0035A2AB90